MSDLVQRLQRHASRAANELEDDLIDAIAKLEHLTRENIELQAKLEQARKDAAMVADIAHSGGMAGHSESSALATIRRLTLPAWNPHGTTDEHRERVKEAGYEAVRRSGA